MVQVPNMHNFRLNAVQHLGKTAVNSRLSVAVPIAGIIDNVKLNAHVVRVALDTHLKIRRDKVLLASEHMNLMFAGETLTEHLRINFGAGVVEHGVAVNDVENFHGAAWRHSSTSDSCGNIAPLEIRAKGPGALRRRRDSQGRNGIISCPWAGFWKPDDRICPSLASRRHYWGSIASLGCRDSDLAGSWKFST